jgi:2-methylcitrate dehydratase PrpD
MPSTTIEQMAEWAAGLRFENIPPRVVEKARWQQASVLAASLAGPNDPGAAKVVAATRQHGGGGDTRVIAGRFRTSRPAAVFANASVSCTFDFDEILLLGHPGHSTVTVPLALGEELGLCWRDAVVAQVAGNELAARIGLATFLGPQNGQMLPYLHCVGGAASAGRLLGLDARELSHALAVALAQPPAALWPSFLGPIEAKVLVAAHGASMGVRAAELASEGFTGALDLLDHSRGFFHRFTFVPLPRALGGLGRTWLSDTLQVKLHAACWYYQALLDGLADAARELRERLGRMLVASDVRRLACRVTFLGEMVDGTERSRPRGALTANEVNFSIPVAAAAMLLFGRLVPDDLTPQSLAANEAELRALASRVEVRHDPALSRRLIDTMNGALDLPGLLGTVSGGQLWRALRRARYEFPVGRSIGGGSILRLLSRVPATLAALRSGRKRAYDLGEHDVSQLVLPISGAFELELGDGTRLEGERDVEEGALSLPEAPARVAAKLVAAARGPLGGERAEELGRAIAAANPDTEIGEILSALPCGEESAATRRSIVAGA